MDLPCFEEKTSAKTNMEPEKGHLEMVRTISKPHISKFGISEFPGSLIFSKVVAPLWMRKFSQDFADVGWDQTSG